MKGLTLVFVSIFIASSVFSQQSLFGGQQIISPEIHDNNSVTFRIEAPGASDVKISGDWMSAEGWTPGSAAMQKDDKGIWSYTSEVLQPELYSYTVRVDGFKMYWIGIGKDDFLYKNVQEFKEKPGYHGYALYLS